jgi:hypothetical protein
MRPSLLLLLLVLPWCSPAAASAQVAKLYPVDEAARQPDFFTFRARLLQTAQTRDTAFLYSVLAPDILNSFGGEGGIAEFKEMWRPEDPASAVWSELTEILSMGGAYSGETLFVAPYTSSSFPDAYAGYEYLAIVGTGVRVRERATTTSAVLAELSFDIVARAWQPPDGSVDGWTAIELADGRIGYVAAPYVRSPVARRAGFVLRSGRWQLQFLVAGD